MVKRAHVVIVGGGFTGALQAINLLRHGTARATIVERRPLMGRGLAYSTAHPDHLLNVRAGNMSAFADDPQHFIRWLALHHPEREGTGFVPRLVYGDYLAELIVEAESQADGRLRMLRGDVKDVVLERGGARVHLTDGRVFSADVVVLAPGNLPPYPPPGVDPAALADGLYAHSPWASPIAEGLAATDTVLAVGTGLTMIDVALLLEAQGFEGRIVALSRRGLAPRAHAGPAMSASFLLEAPEPAASALVGSVRRRVAEVGWHAAIDELRPHTQRLWRDSDLEHRRRFLRHLRPWWDVHRHRIAPEVSERIEAMRTRGRLEVVAGKLLEVAAEGGGRARVTYRPRGSQETRTLDVRRIVNCTGPQGDLLDTREPLLRTLLERGTIRPDPLRIGLDVNERSEVLDRDGAAIPRLVALGPITRGAFWEIVAVPDIRQQTAAVARRLCDALSGSDLD